VKKLSDPKGGMVRAIIIGGILFLVPISVLVIVLAKPLAMAKEVVTPVTDQLPFKSLVGLEIPVLAAFILLLLVCFAAGLFARTSLVRNGIKKVEEGILSRVPGYDILMSFSESVLGKDDEDACPVVILNLDGVRQIALLIEENDDDSVTVFVPDAPSPRTGGVFVVPTSSITLSEIPLATAMSALNRFGVGAHEVMAFQPKEKV
jgi:uncharacterized membrane protein